MLDSHGTPIVSGPRGWTYVAVETSEARAAALAKVWFWVQGAADLDDVCVCPQSPLFLVNGDFEKPADRQGRIPFWSEEKASLAAGPRGGKALLDTEDRHRGKNSLRLSSTADWYAVSSLNYPIWSWSDRWQGRALVRCSATAVARLFLVWSDDNAANVVRVDEGPETSGENWNEVLTPVFEPPSGASVVRLALLVRKGEAWFDDVRLTTLPAKQRVVKALVNQVGYDLGGPKSAVIATNFFPKEQITARVQLLDDKDKAAQEIQAACGGRVYGQDHADWGWYFWRADFSSFDQEGTYRVKATIGGDSGLSPSFSIGKDLVFSKTAPLNVDFFFVQRCGFDVPGWHKACHMDDARVEGRPRDLTGGWHSAGDYNKLSWEYGDGAAMYALARSARSAPDFFSMHDRDHNGTSDAAEEAVWGMRFLSKIQIAETGGLLGDILQGPTKQAYFNWVPPERQTDGVPGTADDPVVGPTGGYTPLAIAGWAILAGLLQSGALREECLSRAEKLLRHIRGRPNHERDPHVLLGAIELHRATKKEEFLNDARQRISTILLQDGPISGGYSDSGDVPCAALATFALHFPSDPLSKEIEIRLRKQIDQLVAEPRNPFGVTHQKFGEDGYFFEPASNYGQNFIFSSRAWAALLIYRLTGDRRAWGYAADQLDWILGKNPYALCMMVGAGSINPPRLHTRYDSIPGHESGTIPGAIANGFVRDVGGYDRPGFDLGRTGRPHPSYRTSEPWLVHNILHLIAVTTLHEVHCCGDKGG